MTTATNKYKVLVTRVNGDVVPDPVVTVFSDELAASQYADSVAGPGCIACIVDARRKGREKIVDVR